MKALLKKLLPTPVLRRLVTLRERRRLSRVQRSDCDAAPLLWAEKIALPQVFASQEIAAHWPVDAERIAPLAIPDGTGGVNPGDRRAIYYLICWLAPGSVLEVGTHIGASTVHIALALARQHAKPGRLVSVDIADVNDQHAQPWLAHGTSLSPRQMVDQLGCGESVEFVAQPSLEFMAQRESGQCDSGQRPNKFDFIFLDGSHSAETVYREAPAALRLLAEGGAILLHDYYPRLEPLWSDGAMIAGPYLAISRLRDEGAALTVVPLGELPWPTKLGSCMTSLALLLKR